MLLRGGLRVMPISLQTLWVLLITRVRSQKLLTIRPECLNGDVICCAVMLLACCCCCSCRLLLLSWLCLLL
jgi:predicted membrane metal-binding protein